MVPLFLHRGIAIFTNSPAPSSVPEVAPASATFRRRALLLLLALAGAGCSRSPELAYIASADAAALPEALQAALREQLLQFCGTPTHPKLLGADSSARDRLQHGGAVYQKRCVHCHGTTGDGAGPAGEFMSPRPRDYRRGIFKFTSTPYGAKPRRSDLVRTIRHGAKGTSMPSFALLSDDDVDAVVDYVLALTHRGELEVLLTLEAQNEDEIVAERVPEIVTEVLAPWNAALDQYVEPVSKMPRYSPESIEEGKKAFLSETAGCFKCHGPDGRAQTTDNLKGFTDVWGFQTRAADLTSACSTAVIGPTIFTAVSFRESTAHRCRLSTPSWRTSPNSSGTWCITCNTFRANGAAR